MHRMLSTVGFRLALLFALALLSGCAFGDRHVVLGYAPVEEEFSASGRIAIVTFTDDRPRDRKQDVGEVRNGLGMVTADVRIDEKAKDGTNQSLGAWIADALAEELQRAGAETGRFESIGAASGYPVVVSGSLTKAWVNMYLQYDAKIRTQVRITRHGAVVFDQPVKGDYETGAVFGSQKEYEKALTRTLQDWVRNAVPEVIAQMR